MKFIKKNIMIFLSAIFLLLILPNKVHAYNSTNFYLNYNNETFLQNLETKIIPYFESVKNDCSNYYDDYLIGVRNLPVPPIENNFQFACYSFDNLNKDLYYTNRSGYLKSLKYAGTSYTINAREYSRLGVYLRNESWTNWYELMQVYTRQLSDPNNIYYIEDIYFQNSLNIIPIYSSVDFFYKDYDSYTSHFFVDNVEILDGEVIPFVLNAAEDPPEINFIAKYNIYYTRMSLLIDIESNIYTNQYSLDGVTWIDIPPNSSMTLYFEKNGYVIARIYDAERDKIINSATFNITQIRTFYNELDEINNKFDNEDLTNPTGFMQMINTFTTDIGDSVAVITILSTYTWNSLNGYIKYFILSIGFIVLIVALIKLFLKGK